jgi:hypothetical protein
MLITDWSVSLSDWILLVTGLVTAVYLCGTWTHSHFKNRNVPYIRPVPFFGNRRPALRSKHKEHFPEYTLRTYRELQGHSYGGTFNFMQPVIILRDPGLIQTITVKDFDHFTNNRSSLHEATELLWCKSLLGLSGEPTGRRTIALQRGCSGANSSQLFQWRIEGLRGEGVWGSKPPEIPKFCQS